jgi:hypothetical protein
MPGQSNLDIDHKSAIRIIHPIPNNPCVRTVPAIGKSANPSQILAITDNVLDWRQFSFISFGKDASDACFGPDSHESLDLVASTRSNIPFSTIHFTFWNTFSSLIGIPHINKCV